MDTRQAERPDRSPRRGHGGVSALLVKGVLLFALTPIGDGLGAEEKIPLSERISAVRSRPVFKTSTFGILIAHVDSGRILYEHNADRLFAPASNTKILSCAGALVALGGDFRFETRIVGAGAVENGVLQGDLVFIASGDPNLSQRVRGRNRLLFENDDHSYSGFSHE